MNNLQDFKNQSRKMWALGSYGEIAPELLPASAHLVNAANVGPRDSVLDVACGTGITSITARKQNANVTGLDLTPELLAQAKQEASIASIEDIEWKEGDVEDLPFEDNVFDVVLSSFGHMFSPRPEICISEIIRVTKSGGRIAFATWPPELAVGYEFMVISKYIQQPPSSPPSPLLWGSPDIIIERFGDKISEIHFERGNVGISTMTLHHYWQYMSTKFGPLIGAIQTIGDKQIINSLKNEFINSLSRYYSDNVLKLDYLVTAAIKK